MWLQYKINIPYSGKFSEGEIFGNFGKNDFRKYISQYSLFLYLEIKDGAQFSKIYFQSVCEW